MAVVDTYLMALAAPVMFLSEWQLFACVKFRIMSFENGIFIRATALILK